MFTAAKERMRAARQQRIRALAMLPSSHPTRIVGKRAYSATWIRLLVSRSRGYACNDREYPPEADATHESQVQIGGLIQPKTKTAKLLFLLRIVGGHRSYVSTVPKFSVMG